MTNTGIVALLSTFVLVLTSCATSSASESLPTPKINESTAVRSKDLLPVSASTQTGRPMATTIQNGSMSRQQPMTPVPSTSSRTARVLIKGLELAVQITPGPYFLSELVTATVTLTNHTEGPVALPNLLEADACGAALGIVLSGGGAPFAPLPNFITPSCPAPTILELKPGHTVTVHHRVPLTRSGHITLAADADLRADVVENDQHSISRIPSPFGGQEPTLELIVSPEIPAGRSFALQRVGSGLVVGIPAGAPPQYLYRYAVTCHDERGTAESGTFTWQAGHNERIALPSCPGTMVEWRVAVSTPGYGIASGVYQ